MSKVPLEELRAFCLTALGKSGLSSEDAARSVDVLVMTDLWGVFTHGTKALRGYVNRLRAGGLKPQGKAQGGGTRFFMGQGGWGFISCHGH